MVTQTGNDGIGEVEELGIDFVPYSPLDKGFLSGTMSRDTTFGGNDFRSGLPRFQPDALAANQGLVSVLGDIAALKKVTPAQIALAWLLARKPWIVPIPGTTKAHRLTENIGSASVELTAEDLHLIDGALARIELQGERHPAHLEALTGR